MASCFDMRRLRSAPLALSATIIALTLASFLTSAGHPAVAAGTPLQVSAGSSHTCAVMDTGSLKCWGANHEGQLGDAEICGTACTTPIQVPDLAPVRTADAGEFHTCAVTIGGSAKCWGRNRDGQLGDGTTAERTIPTDVSGLTAGVDAIASGGMHTCALLSGGTVACWGNNDAGQLGDDRACGNRCLTPTNVASIDSVIAIAAGDAHTCALGTSGAVRCWGDNLKGQLGDSTITSRASPVAVSGLNGEAAAIDAGQMHTCALLAGGSVQCWGDNLYGQLGDGTTISRSVPASVVDLGGKAIAISTGRYHTCALLDAGYVECWGVQLYGPFSEGAFTIRTEPYRATALGTSVVALSAGGLHTCSLLEAGRVRCWGQNGYGQLGIGGTTSRIVHGEVVGIGGDGPKPTPTPTPSPSETASPTVTATPTATQTIESVETKTPTKTLDPTATHTPTQSDTPTPTSTSTSTSTPHLLGDANANGVVNAIDATLILQHAAGLAGSVSDRADVNQDGRIDALDAALVLQAIAGLAGKPAAT
jgi:alpha-tubulin suppressor-like RCC1 family protein